jgi:hypothetical protein
LLRAEKTCFGIVGDFESAFTLYERKGFEEETLGFLAHLVGGCYEEWGDKAGFVVSGTLAK